MFTIRCRILALVVSLPVIFALRASAATITVPAGGSIQTAVTNALPGDTIVVSPGTYTLTSAVRIRKTLTLQGAQAGVDGRTRSGVPESVILVESPSSTSLRAGFSVEADNVVVDGFTFQFTGNAGMFPGRAIVLNTSSTFLGPHHNTVVRNNITRNNADSFLAQDGTVNTLLERNAFLNDISAAVQFEDVPSQTVTIQDNLMDGAPTELSLVTDAVIQRNVLRNSGTTSPVEGSGMRLRGGSANVLIQRNTFLNSRTFGVRLEVRSNTPAIGPNSNVRILGNAILNSGVTGILVTDTALADTLQVHGNRISGNVNYGLNSLSPVLIDAENNWWGCNGGPGGTGCQTVRSDFAGTVDADPWLVLGISATPSLVLPNGTSNIVADLTHNSAGIDASLSGVVPDGTPVAFGTNSGSINPASTATTGGKASALLTVASSNATATATVDGQGVSAVVVVPSTPQILNASASPSVINGVNGKMKDIIVSYTISGGAPPVNSVLTVSAGKTGDVLSPGDYVVVDPHKVSVRASAASNGGDRIYVITITSTDNLGRVATKALTVTVSVKK